MSNTGARMSVTRNNQEGWLALIWGYIYTVEDLRPVKDDDHDEICTVMAWLREDLGLGDEVQQ